MCMYTKLAILRNKKCEHLDNSEQGVTSLVF